MNNVNARGYESNPTESSTDPHLGEDSDASTEQSIPDASNGCAGQGAYTEESAPQCQDGVGQLPDSWDDVDATQPFKLRDDVTPQDFGRAADGADSLLEVTHEIRVDREVAKNALSRLDITVPIANLSAHSHPKRGVDQ